jgi:glycosyltransferase involved in cell wall biosynthesis
MVLEQAKDTFNDNVIQKLDEILTVQHLGVDEDDICRLDDITKDREKIIVFNHRPDTYKNFEPFMKIMDQLWEIRQDFKVWIPLLGKPNRDYVITDKFDKQGYYNFLKKCWVGFSPKQTYGGWSVATTDGMMNGVPYIMYDDTYYKELWENGDFFKSDHGAIGLLNAYLDDRKYRDEMGVSAVCHIADNLVYKNEMSNMSGYINTLIDDTKQMNNSTKLLELIAFIKENGSVTKQEVMAFLGWGRGIKFTPYRRALMNHTNIYDVNGSTPKYVWKE